jgi:hypothetical protein
MLRCRNNFVKNLYVILRQKEQDLARVRKEVEALLTVIPLLEDTETSSDEFMTTPGRSCQSLAASASNRMTDAGIHYPFVETLLRNDLNPPWTRSEGK